MVYPMLSHTIFLFDSYDKCGIWRSDITLSKFIEQDVMRPRESREPSQVNHLFGK